MSCYCILQFSNVRRYSGPLVFAFVHIFLDNLNLLLFWFESPRHAWPCLHTLWLRRSSRSLLKQVYPWLGRGGFPTSASRLHKTIKNEQIPPLKKDFKNDLKKTSKRTSKTTSKRHKKDFKNDFKKTSKGTSKRTSQLLQKVIINYFKIILLKIVSKTTLKYYTKF